MGRFVAAVIVFAMAMVVLKMVIFALIIAGLIFRPRETFGMLVIGGIFALFRVHVLLGLGCVGLLILGAVYVANHKAKGSALRLPNDASP